MELLLIVSAIAFIGGTFLVVCDILNYGFDSFDSVVTKNEGLDAKLNLQTKPVANGVAMRADELEILP